MNITTPDSYLNDAKDKKRKPGRPKGTGKKVKDRIIPPKRPVGRPRRDGLPSGSVTVRAKRVVIHLDDDWSKSSQNDPDTFLSSLVVALSVLPPPVSSGPTAEEAFMSHLNSLAPTSAHNHHLPTLYSILKTFWLPTSPAYFSLTASASARTLSDHRFFYWDPQPLVFDGIACPSCSALLQNEGRIKRGPLKIYDVERPFFIIGAEYVCKNEGKNFASTDPSILRALPTKLRDELPVRLVHANKDVGIDESIWCWKPAGVSKTLWNLVLGCVRGGLKKDLIVKLIRDTQKGVQQVPIAGPSKSSNQSGFTDAYGDAWTANIATANEEDVQTQQSDPLTRAFGLYNQTQSSTTIPPNFIRFKPYEYAPVCNPSQTSSPSGPGNTTLHNTVAPQSASSLISGSPTVAGPSHSPSQQLQAPTSSATRLSPSPNAVTPIITHSSISVTPLSSSSSSSTVPHPSNSYPRVQQPLLSSPSNPFGQHVFDYPMTNYSAQQQQGQQAQQSRPSIQIHNPYQQTHAKLTAAHVPVHPNESHTMNPANTSFGPQRNVITDHIGYTSTTGPSASSISTLPSVSIPQHLTDSGSTPPVPLSSSSTPTSTPAPTSASINATPTSTMSGRQVHQRKPRHCSKCGLTSCKGKGGRSYCTNACKDCGRLECRGRNSRRPDKNCEKGWNK
ncbi:hypothetical protein F5890DRAFT_376925 [Lentinula detonsa]|uniref:DUF6729 domain-containing protein n=1 Tax=Lentinula detonsa TaxID=2804962 RepID=A0AA38UQQ0_9AGAR|nr:hypothetical protein F5890DRAFT_376925 [Lentinula detonsa]